MKVNSVYKKIGLIGLVLSTAVVATAAFAVSGIGGVASQVTGNLGNVAKLITAASYVGGMGFAVAAILKFKAHKDNPTQVPISQGIALLFVAAALIFIPSVFGTTGATLFGGKGEVGKVSGVATFSYGS